MRSSTTRTCQPPRSGRLRGAKLVFESLEPRRVLAGDPVVALAGDYDGSNTVDVADYVVWRDGFGMVGEGLSADGNGDGVVDAADYSVWRDNLGASMPDTPPIATDDTVAVNSGETAVILPQQLLANDCDEGPLEIVAVSNALGGSVVLSDGLIFFSPVGGHHGGMHGMPRSFDYTIRDSAGAEAVATAQVMELAPAHGDGDEQRGAEHAALFTLIDSANATAVAVQDGDWSEPTTWHNGAVPTAGDRVLIHHTVEVIYDTASDTPHEWVRVDGVLSFRHDADTRLVVETLVSDPRGTISIGSAERSIDAEVTTEILIDTSGGALSQLDDPTLIGRGFVTHGSTNIYGAEKLEHSTLAADAAAGDSFIELSDAALPEGWRIGDTLLLVGTGVDPSLLNSPNVGPQIVAADADNSRFQDELLEITGMTIVDGRVRIAFNNVTNQNAIDAGLTTLLWDHTRPDGETFDADELSIHVANLTRNVVIRSSDPTVDSQQRGHFMVMHNVDAEIHHAQFRDLGRSDKRLVVDDPAAIGNFDGSPGGGTNPRGRYGLHLHRLGAGSLDGPAAQVTGNVVWGSPGWGIVHHDSHAVVEDNVVFDVVGAGIVAEDGNELGLWRNNLSVKATGDLVNNFDDGALFQTLRGPRFDLGFVGSGYWVQGGGFGIRMEDNIAASTNAAGFDIVHNTDGLANVEQIPVGLIEDPVVRQAMIDAGFEFVTPNNIPTRGIDGLVAYNGFRGIHTWLHNRDSGDMEGTFVFPTFLAHDFRSTIENYTVWGVQSGVHNFYSTRFDFVNGLVVGDVEDPVPLFIDPGQQGNNSEGIGFGHNHEEANHISFQGLRLEGFEYGFQVFSPFNEVRGEVTPYATSELRDARFANVEHAFIPTNGSNPDSQQHRFSDLFVIDEASIFSTLDNSNAAPIAAFTGTGGEGLSVVLDAAASFDSDPSEQVRAIDDGIAAYAWDLDGDGLYDDAYGQTITVSFDTAGVHTIGLMVWDDDGATATVTQPVAATPQPFTNPWIDGDFSDGGAFEGEFYRFSSGRRGDGWIARDVQRNPAGFAEIATPQFGLGNLGQIIRDEHVRRGEQEFSFDAIAIDGLGQANLLQVRLFGVDGQFDLDGDAAPSAIDAMAPPEVATLVDINVAANQIADWQTQAFSVDLGSDGYEYLIVTVQYAGYNVAQGDYFALDNFSLVGLPGSIASPPLSYWASAAAAHASSQRALRDAPRDPVMPAPTLRTTTPESIDQAFAEIDKRPADEGTWNLIVEEGEDKQSMSWLDVAISDLRYTAAIDIEPDAVIGLA
ncbi:MAG: G8 domain-containing protein [Planctomycetota bacterium]